MQKGIFISKEGQGSFPWSWIILECSSWQKNNIQSFIQGVSLYWPVFNKLSRVHFFKYRLRFVANCRYRQWDFFHTWYMKIHTKLWKCERFEKKISENRKHLVLWKSYTYLQLWFSDLLVINCHKNHYKDRIIISDPMK